MPNGYIVKVNGDPGLLSRNTIPGEQPWRVTWFDREDHEPNGHVDISVREARRIRQGQSIEIHREDSVYYVDPGEDILEAGLVWRGYPCTQDCSGHQAGDSWAQARGIKDPDQCPPGNSNSWWEGCRSEAEGRPI